jgi:hypothetical protein
MYTVHQQTPPISAKYNTKPPDDKKPLVAIPYVKGLFEKLKVVCRNDLLVVGKGDNTLKNFIFSKLKDRTPMMLQSNVVYQVTCECGVIYTGQSLQWLRKRLYQHKLNIKNSNGDHSALCKHAIDEKHVPLWDQVKIVYHESNKKKREVLEMIAIKKSSNSINKQTDSIMLASAYDNII